MRDFGDRRGQTTGGRDDLLVPLAAVTLIGIYEVIHRAGIRPSEQAVNAGQVAFQETLSVVSAGIILGILIALSLLIFPLLVSCVNVIVPEVANFLSKCWRGSILVNGWTKVTWTTETEIDECLNCGLEYVDGEATSFGKELVVGGVALYNTLDGVNEECSTCASAGVVERGLRAEASDPDQVDVDAAEPDDELLERLDELESEVEVPA